MLRGLCFDFAGDSLVVSDLKLYQLCSPHSDLLLGLKKFLVLTYVVALVLLLLKWAHLSLNSKRLSRYDATNLTLSHAISRIWMENLDKSDPDFSLWPAFPAVWSSDWPKKWHIWSCQEFIWPYAAGFLIFHYFAFFRVFQGEILANMPKFDLKWP